MVRALFIFILSIAVLPGTVKQNNQNWQKIGVITVDFKNPGSEILVLKSEIFSSIKFRVSSSPLLLTNIEIFYETGENQHIGLNLLIEPDKDSRAIELTGGERKLVKVSVEYKKPSVTTAEKSNIQLWGLKKGGS